MPVKMPADPPMIAFDPFTADDYNAMFKKHSWTERSEVDIDQYLTPQERTEMCDYEKDRLRNIKKNYDVMIDMGLPAKKPYFMMKNRPKFYQPVDESSESDGEWVPAKNKPRAKKPIVAGWKPPVKKIEVTLHVKSSKVSAKERPSKPKTKKKGKTEQSKSTKKTPSAIDTTAVSEKLQWSDTDDDDADFIGFSAADIEKSAAHRDEVVPRNEAILAAIEAGTYDFGLSDSDDEEEGESPDSQPAEIPQESSTHTAEPPPVERPGRYPRRNIARKVYTEPEVPKDDDYLYCEECDEHYEGDCPVHGPLLIIPDTKVANDGSDPDRAVHSLPKGLVVRKSQILLAGDGVWAEQPVCKGARFGPYEGVKEEDGDEAHKSGYCWVILADGKEVSHYVDAGDKSRANWLRYVNCARNEGEQNLLAYQFHGEVYYRTVKEIQPGQELLVWYGDEYGRELGLLMEDANKETAVQRVQLGQDALKTLFTQAGFELWVCEVCGRVFPSESWRDGHRRAHGDRTGSKRYTCTQCNYSSDDSGNYNRHLVTHSGDRPYTCNVCGKGFTQSGDLTRHMRTHTGERPYVCTVCNKGFTTLQHLQRHMRTHTGDKPYTCPICKHGFSTSGDLTTHMRTHTGEKPYVCNTCGHRCSTSGDLTKHMRTHTGELPYRCNTCGYRCSQSSVLTKHMRTHTGELPYRCNTCGMAFSTSTYLKYHTFTHTGQWPHSCTLCNKGFAKPGLLRKHMESTHRS